MIGTVIVAAIIALLAGFLGTLIALKVQYRYLQTTQAQRKAWEHAQESAQRNWEIKQEKRFLELDAKLAARLQMLENDWNVWKQKIAELAQAVAQQHSEIAGFLHIERELARIPLVEEMPIAFDGKGQRLPTSSRWHPLSLARVDLCERDLSRRYLGQANLHQAQLQGTNFFMADLSGADLSGADLTGADLTGANLSHADLRNAILLNANLQVADLHNTILFGANLRGTRNLSMQQLDTAIYDATSQLDTDFDCTIPRLPRINKGMLTSTSSVQIPSIRPTVSDIPTMPNIPAIPATPIVKRKKATASQAAEMAKFIEVETPDLEISNVPVFEAQVVTASPELPESSEFIEGEITEITGSVTIESGTITETSSSETIDAATREMSDAEISEISEVETRDFSETDGGAANDDKDSEISEAELSEIVDSEPILESIEEVEVPDIAPLPITESFELPVSEGKTQDERPSSTEAGSFETEAPAATPPSEPEFVTLEIEHGTNGNGHENGNGHKQRTPTETAPQRGKSNSRRRTRTR
jgi:Pentapeptide repeats (8 copies)